MNIRIIIPIFITSFAVLFLHQYAIAQHLYWKYWWYDNIVHFIGGITISLIVLFYAERFSLITNTAKVTYFLFGAVSALIVSVAWELFEYRVGISFVNAPSFGLDTTLDIFMGLLGALFGTMYAHTMKIKTYE